MSFLIDLCHANEYNKAHHKLIIVDEVSMLDTFITYSLLNFSYEIEKSFKKKGSSIFIDGTEFVKD